MRPVLLALPALFILAGCDPGITRMDKLERVQSAVFTDARSLAPQAPTRAGAPLRITSPDQLIAISEFIKSLESEWKLIPGTPRPTRYQLELMGESGPLYTLWIAPGYVAMSTGKRLQEARLTSSETAKLLACLGLPPGYMDAADPPQSDGASQRGFANAPAGSGQPGLPESSPARTVHYEIGQVSAEKMHDQ